MLRLVLWLQLPLMLGWGHKEMGYPFDVSDFVFWKIVVY